ncbi:unnamed protein product [Pocillopora meandrina]|uniref:Uncharacterized protein n=1 Tax=Pocillopora meandrina TaxID=46732 RepID=A0AAU9XCI6_9CNID|nr:unnamed protein product [Pocillopora meandrina]
MQLTCLNKLTKENIFFQEPVVNKYGNKTIQILTNYGESRHLTTPLVIESPLLFSFGVKKSVDEDEDLIGYSMPTCLWSDYKQPSQKQLDFYSGLKKIEMICHEHLDKVFGPEISEMIKLPLVEKDEKAPILYSKLIFSKKKTQKIYTIFHSKENNKENPLDYIDQYCKVKMSLIIDSIHIGDKTVTVQIKVNDIFIKPLVERQVLKGCTVKRCSSQIGYQFG